MQSAPANSSPSTSQVQIHLGDRSYPIVIGTSLLSAPASFAGLPQASQALIVSNTTVAPLYAQALQSALQAHFVTVHVVALPDGEKYKTWETLNLIFDALLSHACDRKTVLFALGGGSVGDLTGFGLSMVAPYWAEEYVAPLRACTMSPLKIQTFTPMVP